MTKKSVERKIIDGSLWTIFLNVFVRMLGFISILILARFLNPRDLGVYAAAAVVIELVNVLTQTGVETILVQKVRLSVSHYQTAWTINIIRGAIIFCILQIFAQFFITAYSSDPGIRQAIQVIAFSALISCFSSAYFINFQKHIDFKTIAKVNIICRLTGFVATIIAAYILRSFWALVVGNFSITTMNLLLSHKFAPGKHRLTLSEGKHLIGSSRWVIFHEVCAFFSLQFDKFLITRFLGAKSLGIYDVGYQIAMVPIQEIALPVSRVLFPGLASLAHDREAFRNLLTSFLAAIFYLSVPAAVGLFLVAELLVSSLFPVEWFGTIEVIEILVVLALVRSFFGPTISALMGAGQLELNAKLSALSAFLSLLFLSFGMVTYGLIGMMSAAVFVSVIRLSVYLGVLQKLGMFRIYEYLTMIWRAVISTFLMAFCVESYIKIEPETLSLNPISMLLTSISIGMISYTFFITLIWALSGRHDGIESSVINWAISHKKGMAKK
jgi:O-antigen/teichoic acid export membrane protein